MSTEPIKHTEEVRASADNRLQLDNRHWAVVIVVTSLFVFAVPRLWPSIEARDHRVNYRVPYTLSRDYWLYSQHLFTGDASEAVFVVGDSVVWGEFVDEDGTLSAALNQLSNGQTQFKNSGVNGLFPLALEGLIRNYGAAMYSQRVLLHCNLLWMSNPEADLSTPKTQVFNHQELVPQFSPWLSCYSASVDERVDRIVHRRSNYFAWANHIQLSYFEGQSIPDWSLADAQSGPGSNAYRNPLAQVTLKVPESEHPDPDRGTDSPRHKAWFERGLKRQTLEWVSPDDSQQWPAFCRLVELLRDRDCELIVVVGPLNRHMMNTESQRLLDEWQSHVVEFLVKHGVEYTMMPVLDSDDYADASHPLTRGYSRMAEELWKHETMKRWCEQR